MAAQHNSSDSSKSTVTSMTGGTADTAIAANKVDTININYSKETENICTKCKKKLKKIGQEGDTIESLIKRQQGLFSESRSFLQAWEKLESKRVVVITGAPEEGKTTLAVQLCHTFMKGNEAVYHAKWGKADLDGISNKTSVTIIDNMFEEGYFGKDGVSWQTLCKIEKELKNEQSKSRFIIVCQLFDMKKAEHDLESALLKWDYVVNISRINCSEEEERWRERLQVLQKLNPFIPNTQKIKIAQNTPFQIGFAGMCAFHDKMSCIIDPGEFYMNQLKSIMEKDPFKAGIFIFMAFCEGVANFSHSHGQSMDMKLKTINELFPSITFETLKTEAKYLNGTYLKHNDDGTFAFDYPVLYDSCVVALTNHYPKYILEHCTLKFCDHGNAGKTERTKENDEAGNVRDEEKCTFQITRLAEVMLTDNLVNELKSRNMSNALQNPSLQFERIRNALFKKLKYDLADLVKDTDNGGNLLFWSAASENKDLTSHVLRLPEISGREVDESIISCAEKGSTAALNNLNMALGECPPGTKLQININHKKSDKTPLMLAAMNGHSTVVNQLLKMEADPSMTDDNGRNCAHFAAASRDVETFNTINLSKKVPRDVLNSKDNNGFTPKMVAVTMKDEALFNCCSHSNATGEADSVQEDNLDTERIHLACMRDEDEKIYEHISKNSFEINATFSDGNTPVMSAAQYASEKVYDLIMPVRKSKCDLSKENDDGCNILHNACIGGSLKIVKHVVQHMNDLNSRNKKGWTPVMLAAYMGHSKVFQFLVDKGCELSGQDTTVLHAACMGGSTGIVECILSRGLVDTETKDCYGKTAMEIASKHGHDKVVELLCGRDAETFSGPKKQEVQKRPLKQDVQTPPADREVDEGDPTKRKPPAVAPKPKPKAIQKRTAEEGTTANKAPSKPTTTSTTPSTPPSTPPQPPTSPTQTPSPSPPSQRSPSSPPLPPTTSQLPAPSTPSQPPRQSQPSQSPHPPVPPKSKAIKVDGEPRKIIAPPVAPKAKSQGFQTGQKEVIKRSEPSVAPRASQSQPSQLPPPPVPPRPEASKGDKLEATKKIPPPVPTRAEPKDIQERTEEEGTKSNKPLSLPPTTSTPPAQPPPSSPTQPPSQSPRPSPLHSPSTGAETEQEEAPLVSPRASPSPLQSQPSQLSSPPVPLRHEGDKREATKRIPPPVPPRAEPKDIQERTEEVATIANKPLSLPPTTSTPPPQPPPSSPTQSPSQSPQPSPLHSPPTGSEIEVQAEDSMNTSPAEQLNSDKTVEEDPVYTITDRVSRASCPVSCPAMTLDPDRVNEDLSVSESGELVNGRGSGGDHRGGRLQWYWGTCSRLPIPLPPSPSTLTAPRYWETQSRIQVKGVSWPVYIQELGVCGEEKVDTGWMVAHQSGSSWCVRAGGCTEHGDICTEVWGEGRLCGGCHRNYLSLTPGTGVHTIHWGVILDIGRGRLAFVDVTRRRVIHKFDVDIRESLRPMFGVTPYSNCDVKMKLLSGSEIDMDDRKKDLIERALFEPSTPSAPSAPTQEFEQPEHITYEGFLYRQGTWLKQWKKRWFVLDSMEHNQLMYYKSKYDSDCEGFIDLADVKLVYQRASKKSEEKRIFEIHTVLEQFKFKADSPTSAQEWIDKLKRCLP